MNTSENPVETTEVPVQTPAEIDTFADWLRAMPPQAIDPSADFSMNIEITLSVGHWLYISQAGLLHGDSIDEVVQHLVEDGVIDDEFMNSGQYPSETFAEHEERANEMCRRGLEKTIIPDDAAKVLKSIAHLRFGGDSPVALAAIIQAYAQTVPEDQSKDQT